MQAVHVKICVFFPFFIMSLCIIILSMFCKTRAKKKIITLLAFILIEAGIFSQSIKIPMVNGEHNINGVAWSLDSSCFAYVDGSDIVIRDSYEFFTCFTIKTDYTNIRQIKFIAPVFNYSEEDSQYILLVTDTGIIEIHQFFYSEDETGAKTYNDKILFTLAGNIDAKISSFTSTQDISFIAMGYEDGSLSLYNYNTINNEYIEESYKISEAPVKTIDISTKKDMLLTCTDDGIIYVWNNSMELLSSFEYYQESSQPVYFTDDNGYPIICAVDDSTLSKFSLESLQKRSYSLMSETPIKNYIVSYDRKTVLMLDENNILNVYDLNDGKFIGFIPNFSESPVTIFQTDFTQSRFLIVHEDNTIFVLETNKVLFPKNAVLPDADLIHVDSENALERLYEQPEEQVQEDEEIASDEEEPQDDKHQYEALAMIRYKNSDTISFRLKATVTPGPFIIGTSFAAGYTAYRLMQPFYIGAFLEPHFGFPQKDFPYKYRMNGSAISSPIITGGKLYMPFGICVYPFQQNIEFFVDLAPGIVMNMLWNSQFAKKSITSKLYTGFYGALRTGMTYRNFSVYLEGNYDAILGFGFSIGVGYSINLAHERRNDEIWSLEEEDNEEE